MCTTGVHLGEHGSESYFSSAASTASMDPGSEADYEKDKTHFYQNDPSAPMQVRFGTCCDMQYTQLGRSMPNLLHFSLGKAENSAPQACQPDVRTYSG